MYKFRDTTPIDTSLKTDSGSLVTIDNPTEEIEVKSLTVSLPPIQDLNGYDKPWVGGAGKNLMRFRAINTTLKGATFVSTGEKISIVGTATGNVIPYAGTESTAWETAQFGPYPAGQYTAEVKGFTPSQPTDRIVFNGVYEDGSHLEQFPNGIRISEGAVTFTATAPFKCGLWISITSGSTINSPNVEAILNKGSTIESWTPYSNICPISGRTSVETTRTGKNLCGISASASATYTSNGITWTKVDDSTIHVQGTATAQSVCALSSGWSKLAHAYLPSGTYRASTDADVNLRIGVGASNTNKGNAKGGFAVTLDTDSDVWIGVFVQSGTTIDKDIHIQLELGSTATDYEPYQGTTYTTALGRTVYGGTLDVVSGMLTVTHGYKAFGGGDTTPWYFTNRSDKQIVYTQPSVLSGVKTSAGYQQTALFDRFATALNSSQIFIGYAYVDVGWLNIVFEPNTFADANAFRTWLSSNNVQVVYELATPQTYQLTPQQVELLAGTNNIWSDGDITVQYQTVIGYKKFIPAEAVSINGQYLENAVDGYRTLYTKGRESLEVQLDTYSVGVADGETFKSKRYPARKITVGFQLIAPTNEEFRRRFNALNNLLSLDEADFIFADETDKYFAGIPIFNAEVETGENSVKGEWEIYCAYPFKRSVKPITLTMSNAEVTNTTATFAIEYKGGQPARPILRAKFAGAKSGGSSSEDGDCGFVAFMDGNENIIQLGNPDVIDRDEYTSATTLVNFEFINTSGWATSGTTWENRSVTGSVSSGTLADAFWMLGAGQTQNYAVPSYGSGTGWHGALLKKTTSGAVNFTIDLVHRLCVSNANETGTFECGARDANGVMVAGFVIDKTSNGTTGTVNYIVNNEIVGRDSIDLGYYNEHFGYCNRTPVYVQETYYDPVTTTTKVQVKTKKKKKKKKYKTVTTTTWVAKVRTVQSGWNYTQSNLNSSISKNGQDIAFTIGNLPTRTYTVPAVLQTVSTDLSMYMGTNGTPLNTNAVHSVLFRREAGVPFAEQPNVFTAGDIVQADCNDATVFIYRDGSIGGHLEPQYGALGNDWESFMLTNGVNTIRATWSDWVNATYKPQIEIEYNEVFI